MNNDTVSQEKRSVSRKAQYRSYRIVPMPISSNPRTSLLPLTASISQRSSAELAASSINSTYRDARRQRNVESKSIHAGCIQISPRKTSHCTPINEHACLALDSFPQEIDETEEVEEKPGEGSDNLANSPPESFINAFVMLEDNQSVNTNHDTTDTDGEYCRRIQDFNFPIRSSTSPTESSAAYLRVNKEVSFSRQNAITPPATPSTAEELYSLSVNNKSGEGKWFHDFQELQMRYGGIASELEQVRAQYLNSLKELEDLSAQRDELILRQQPSSRFKWPSLSNLTNFPVNSTSILSTYAATSAPSSPKPMSISHSIPSNNFVPLLENSTRKLAHTEAHGESAQEELLETIMPDNDTHSILPSESRLESAHPALESVWNASLKLAHNLNGGSVSQIKKAFANSGIRNLQTLKLPLMRSLSLSLPQVAYFSGLPRAPNSPAIHSSPSVCSSPTPAQLAIPHDPMSLQIFERSYESLEKEIIKLQEVLKERDDEIQTLEVTIRQVHRASGAVACPTLPPASQGFYETNEENLDGYFSTTIPEGSQKEKAGDSHASASGVRVASPPKNIFHDSVRRAFSNAPDSVNLATSDEIKSLDLLMRSMAKKESAFLELIASLKSQLGITRREHQELVKLSRDQMLNMSSEIEALRKKLAISQSFDPDMSQSSSQNEISILNVDKQLPSAAQDIETVDSADQIMKREEIAELEAQHGSELEKLRTEHSKNYERLLSSTNDRLVTTNEELKKIETRWQAQLEAELISQASFIRAECETKHHKILGEQTVVFNSKLKDQQKVFNEEIHSLLQEHAISTVKLRDEMDANLQNTKFQFESQLQGLKLLHAQEVEELNHQSSSAASKLESNLRRTIVDYQNDLKTWENLRVQLEARNFELEQEKQKLTSEIFTKIENLKSEHSYEISQLQLEHDEILISALAELDKRRTQKFEELLKAREESYLWEINALKMQHEKRLSKSSNETKFSTETHIGELRAGNSGEFASPRSHPAQNMLATMEIEVKPSQPQYPQSLNQADEYDLGPQAQDRLSYPGTPTFFHSPGVKVGPIPRHRSDSLSTQSVRSRNTFDNHELSRSFFLTAESKSNLSGRDSVRTSLGNRGTIDRSTLEPQVIKKIEEQQNGISNLSKQLVKCEANLTTNAESIAQLESALNETERSLRKSRLQMNELAQERDKMFTQNETLRKELARSNSDIETMKRNIAEERHQLESRLNDEKLARELAKKQLDSRMLEMQKNQGKKSKFNCF